MGPVPFFLKMVPEKKDHLFSILKHFGLYTSFWSKTTYVDVTGAQRASAAFILSNWWVEEVLLFSRYIWVYGNQHTWNPLLKMPVDSVDADSNRHGSATRFSYPVQMARIQEVRATNGNWTWEKHGTYLAHTRLVTSRFSSWPHLLAGLVPKTVPWLLPSPWETCFTWCNRPTGRRSFEMPGGRSWCSHLCPRFLSRFVGFWCIIYTYL